MLVFVVPLKSQKVAKSWERTLTLFERCMKSICNQTSSEFRVVVVCHEVPQIKFSHPCITYVSVDFPFPTEKNIVSRGDTDKARKMLKGLIYARKFSPTHTMAVDADDCVSKNLAAFVKKNINSNGWFINKGYKYQESSKYIYVKRNNFYRMCGSANILKYELNYLPENPEYNRGYGYYKYYIHHAKIKEVLKSKGTLIKPLPFAGAVYVVGNGENIFYDDMKLQFHILNRRTLKKSIINEFGLYQLSS